MWHTSRGERMELIGLVKMIVFAIGALGVAIISSAVIDLINLVHAQAVVGDIVDFVQEYTTRGFLWKAKVQYQRDGITHTYITRARTTRRGTDHIKIYITDRGRIIEFNYMIEKIIIALISFALAFTMIAMIY
jgi:hypothetical protein